MGGLDGKSLVLQKYHYKSLHQINPKTNWNSFNESNNINFFYVFWGDGRRGAINPCPKYGRKLSKPNGTECRKRRSFLKEHRSPRKILTTIFGHIKDLLHTSFTCSSFFFYLFFLLFFVNFQNEHKFRAFVVTIRQEYFVHSSPWIKPK